MRYYSSTVGEKSLAVALTDSDNVVTLNNLDDLPSFPFTLVIDPDVAGLEEIVLVTAAAATPANSLTVVRGTDTSNGVAGGNGTTKKAHALGVVVKHMVTARDLQEPQTHMAATSGVHGVTGDIVGSSATQTLTNKTINSASNNLTVAQSSVTGLSTALDGKAPIVSPTFTGTVVLPDTTSIGTVSNTEIGFLDGVTSNLQTQIDGKISEPAGAGNGFLTYTDSGDSTTVRSVAATAPITVSNADGQSGNPTIGIDGYDNTAWTSFSPSLNNISLGTGGTMNCYFKRVGKTVFARYKFTLGTSPSITGSVSFGLPSSYSALEAFGFPVPVATTNGSYLLVAVLNSTTGVALQAVTTGATYAQRSNVTNTVPGSFASGDTIAFMLTYEAA